MSHQSVRSDKLHKKQGGPFPATFPKEKRAPHRVKVWIPRAGSDLMISVLDGRGTLMQSRSLFTRDPKEAEAAAWKLIGELAVRKARDEESVPELSKKTQGPLRMGRLISAYLQSANFASLSSSFQVEKETMLKRWIEFFGQKKLVEEITRDDIKGYELRRRQEVKQQTIYNEWSAFRSVVNWSLGERLLLLDPLIGISVASEKNPRQVNMTHAEFLALRNGSRGKVPLVQRVYLCAVEATARRKMSVARLRWKDIDLDGETITWTEENDKTGKQWEEIPGSRRLVRLLRMWKRHSPGEWVFESPRGQPYSKRAIDSWMTEMHEAAGLVKPPGGGFHSLRRKFATETKGESMKDVMELGGWKSQAAFMRYVQPDKNTQRAIANRRRKGVS